MKLYYIATRENCVQYRSTLSAECMLEICRIDFDQINHVKYVF